MNKNKLLLLHTCCGPCAAYPLKALTDESSEYNVSGLFYNPNIMPDTEYEKRADAAETLFAQCNVPLIRADRHMFEKWREWEENARLELAAAHKAYAPAERDGYNKRCLVCYDLRLSFTAMTARDSKFDAFSTTLLISPYQNHELIKSTCEKYAIKYGVDFYYRDFRPRFREGQNMARELVLYRQKYCGCIFSRNTEDHRK